LGDLTSQQNNRQALSNQETLPIKQSFTIFQDGPSSNTTSNKHASGHPIKFNDENQPPAGQKILSNKFPPPPPIPLATSSPASCLVRKALQPTREKSISHSSTSSAEGEIGSSAAAASNLVDPYTLISKTSASQYRRNNESISSMASSPGDDIGDNEGVEPFSCDDDNRQEDNVINELATADSSILEAGGFTSEYHMDILTNMKKREKDFLPKWNYMTKQPDITFTMRSILIDWLIEVGEEYKLGTETLFLAVSYIDRFLSHMSVQRAKLQLVGTACMFIAAKYQEIYPPDVTEFCYITDDTYSKRQVLRMEQLVLSVLNWNVAPPTAYFFVNFWAGLAGCGPRTTAMAQYLTELTMIDGEAFMPFAPSIIASAAVALARHTLGMAAWEDEPMVSKTGYSVEDFKECLIRLHETFERAPEMAQQAVREKYKNASYYSVSEVKPTPVF
jgi:cyclin A